MKKHLLWLSVVIVMVFLTSFQQQVKEVFNPEKPVTKNISLAMYAGGNYSSAIYDASAAQLQVIVYKVRGNKYAAVWEKTFDAMELKKIPACSNALSQQVSISNVFDKKEQLVVVYHLTYNSKGSVLETQNGAYVSKGKKADKLYISI